VLFISYSSQKIFKDFNLYFCSPDALVFQIMQGHLSIVGGFGFGILWGLLGRYVPDKRDVSSVMSSSPQCSCYDVCRKWPTEGRGWFEGFNPLSPRNSVVLTKLRRIHSSVENKSVKT
jgi:hypothetical protein